MTTPAVPDDWPAPLPPGPPRATPPRRVPCGFRVIVDTREQQPYHFDALWDGPAGRSNLIDVPTVRLALPVADYSVEGHPGILIERKSKADLYGSVSQSRENFEGRLARMHGEYDSPWVLVECEWQELLTAPPEFTRFSPKSLTRTILAWMVRYDRVRWLMAPSRAHAEAFCFRLMERYVKENQSIDRACRASPARPGDLARAATANAAGGAASPPTPPPPAPPPRRSAPPRRPAADAPSLLDAP